MRFDVCAFRTSFAVNLGTIGIYIRCFSRPTPFDNVHTIGAWLLVHGIYFRIDSVSCASGQLNIFSSPNEYFAK